MGPLKYFDSIIPYCPHHPTSEHPSFFITIIMGMNSSRLMAVAAILAALTSIEVEACLGEPCKIGNPTMCRLIRETNRAGSVSTHSSLLGEPMPDAHRRLVSAGIRRRLGCAHLQPCEDTTCPGYLSPEERAAKKKRIS